MTKKGNSILIGWMSGVLMAAVLALPGSAQAQTCLTASDMDDATREALVRAASNDFDLLSRGDAAALKQASSTSLASDFSSIEGLVQENRANLSQASASPRPPFLLKAEKPGATAAASVEFLCGVFGARGQTANSAEFVIPNLPAGSYGIVMLDAAAKTPVTATFVLLQQNAAWKLAGRAANSAAGPGAASGGPDAEGRRLGTGHPPALGEGAPSGDRPQFGVLGDPAVQVHRGLHVGVPEPP